MKGRSLLLSSYLMPSRRSQQLTFLLALCVLLPLPEFADGVRLEGTSLREGVAELMQVLMNNDAIAIVFV